MRQICFSITRSLVIIVNLLILTLALLLIYVSLNAFEDYEIDSFNDSQSRLVHTYVSIICAGLGIIIALLSLLGLIGAIRKSKSVLGTYAVIILLLVSLLFITVFLTYSLGASASSYKEIDKTFVNSTVVIYNHVDSSDIKSKLIDRVQVTLACCGVNGPADWTEYALHKIPKSCCSEPTVSSLPIFKYCAESDYKIGCWQALTNHFHANLNAVRVVLYSLISFGLICAACAGFLVRTLKKNLDVV